MARRVLAILLMPAHALSLQSRPTRRVASDVERWTGGLMATAVMAYGLSRRSMPGVALAAAAVPLAYRSVTGDWPRLVPSYDDTRTALAGNRGIHVREAIRLEVPRETIYCFWRQLRNLPRFMTHLTDVREVDSTHSIWIATGPGDVEVEWEAAIINDIPNELIAWRSLPGSEIATAGSVHFSNVRQGRSTQVTVHLQYAAPGGSAGRLLALVLGRDPASMIREDLRRVKQLLEAGEIPRATRGAEA